jgi:hypothetical protein
LTVSSRFHDPVSIIIIYIGVIKEFSQRKGGYIQQLAIPGFARERK